MSLTALQDLFLRHREKATGVWKLGQEPGRTIYFDYGDAVFAQSTHLQDRLTYILVERGKVTQAQMDYALANLKPGLSIGKNLIEMGFITQRDLLEVAKAQVERIICGSLATPGQTPVFEARELDANVVRLPLSTAQVFLAGVLALQDREGLLELLGPLNQVVVLQGRSLMDLSLPPDLAKLPPLLDGTHTLLELSRESMAEPVRLGAFALFLREIGWARLHEMPPLDRHALDLAFTPEPEPLSALLTPAQPEAFPETVPSLFATIQEAERPTTNLEHLSLALDADPVLPSTSEGLAELLDATEDPEPLYLPESLSLEEELRTSMAPPVLDALDDDGAFPWASQAATGQAELPTPAVPLPPMVEPGELDRAEEPRVLLQLPPDPEAGLVPDPAAEAELPAASANPMRRLILAGLVVVVLVVGLFLFKRRASGVHPAAPKPLPTESAPASHPGPAPAQPPPVAVSPAAQPESAAPEPAKPEPAKLEPAKPAAAKPEASKPAAAAISTKISDRLAAISKGDLGLALQQGQARAKEIPAGHWALRLEIACQGDTIRRVTEIFKGEQPDLYLLPMTLRDGRACYQVLYGSFPSKGAAEKQMKRLPAAFRTDGNRPKAFKLAELPKVQ